MKLRTYIVAGVAAGLSFVPFVGAHAAVTPNGGSCGTTAPAPYANALPDGGTAGGDTSGGGIQGPHGYLSVTPAGSPTAGSLTIQGNNPDSGLNGSVSGSNSSNSGSACVGDTQAGQGATVTAP